MTPLRRPSDRSAVAERDGARETRLRWRSRDILRAVALAVAVYYVLQLVWAVNAVLLTAFLGLLFGLALTSAVDALARFRVPRGVGAAVVVLALYGALVGAGFWIAPTLRAQASELRARLPEAVQRMEGWLEAQSSGLAEYLDTSESDAASQAAPAGAAPPAGATRTTSATAGSAQPRDEAPSTLRDAFGDRITGMTRYVGPLLSRTATLLGGLLLVTFVAVYMAVEPRTYRDGLLLLVPQRARGRAREVLDATGTVLRRWLVTQLIAMVIIGAVTTGLLLVLQVEAAVALGVVAGLLEFVPFIGPIIAAVPAIAMAFLGSPEKALWVLGAYVVIQQLESNLLMPLLMREGLKLPPILTLLAQGVMAVLFGFLGLLVAVPLLAAVLVPVKMLYVRDVVGEDVDVLGTDEHEDGDADADAADDAHATV